MELRRRAVLRVLTHGGVSLGFTTRASRWLLLSSTALVAHDRDAKATELNALKPVPGVVIDVQPNGGIDFIPGDVVDDVEYRRRMREP